MLTRDQMWKRYAGTPPPSRWEHGAGCNFCDRERRVKETTMSEAFETIPCETEDEWLARRKEGIGGSEAAAVLGVSPWLSPVELWGLKTGVIDPAEDNARFAWGRRLEDDIIDAYAEETGRLVIPNDGWTLTRSRDVPFMQATLDAEIAPIDDRGPGVFEAKSAVLFKQDEWQDEPPLQYLCQFQHTLKVKGYQWGSIAVVFGNYKFVWMDLDRNDAFIEYLVQKERAFWELVKTEQPPPLEGEGAKELLLRLFPKPEPDKVIELPSDSLAWHQELQETKEQLKKLKAREEALKIQFAAALGDAEMGVLASGDSYTYRAVHKEPYTVAAQDYRELRFRAKKGSK